MSQARHQAATSGSSTVCKQQRVKARGLLQFALDNRIAVNTVLAANIHLSYLAVEEGEEKDALSLLKKFFNMLVNTLGRDRCVQALVYKIISL